MSENNYTESYNPESNYLVFIDFINNNNYQC